MVLPFVLAAVSCDKVKQYLPAKPETQEVKEIGNAPGGEADSDLAALVQRQNGAVSFRKDLPFPSTVTVTTDERVIWTNARKTDQSALGRESVPFTGIYETSVTWSLEKGKATISVEKAGAVVPPQKDKEAAGPAPLELDQLKSFQGKTVHLQGSSSGWIYAPTSKQPDFQEMVWGKAIAPLSSGLLAEAGLLPRTRWLASAKYWKAGDTVELTGEALQMLFPGKPSGKVILTFVGEEAVSGHPTGKFSFKGEVESSAVPRLDGEPIVSHVAFSSGTVWLSLIHPLVLREEYEAVQTVTRGTNNNPSTKLQGTTVVTRSRTWEKIATSS